MDSNLGILKCFLFTRLIRRKIKWIKKKGDEELINEKWNGIVHDVLSSEHITVKSVDNPRIIRKVAIRNVKLLKSRKLIEEEIKFEKMENELKIIKARIRKEL